MNGSIRILHVDDDPNFVELVATFLEREDDRFAVEVATDAEEVLARLDDAVDCVVSDYEMPDTDGVELLERVREDYPDLPFVLFTGRGSEEVASEAISAGVTDYLQKETGTSQYAVLANRIANAVEQYRSKRELEASRDRLSMFFEQSPLGVIEWNEDFEFERVNAAAEEILGYDETELLGASWDVVVPEDDFEEVDEVTSALLENEAGYHNVNENVTAEGEVIVCEWHNRVITDADGAVVAVFSLFQDVTDRKEREWQLERHRESLEELHEAANRLYAADSLEECYDVTIEAAVTILGFDWCTLATPAQDDPGTFEIRAISEETPLEVGDRPFATDEGLAGHVFQTEEPSVVNHAEESEHAKPTSDRIRSGLTVPVGDWGIFQAVSTTPEAFDDQDLKHAQLLVASMLAAFERIEQQAELRERQRALRRQNERLDEFASVVSHDLRNPLSVADGRLKLAMEEVESEHLGSVARAHDRMQTLIDDLLALARHGETPAEVESLDLETVARRSWSAVASSNASLEVDVDATIRADETRLRQLFENCFRNSVEHGSASPPSAAPREDAVERDSTDPGSETLRIGAEGEERDGHVTVRVGGTTEDEVVDGGGDGDGDWDGDVASSGTGLAGFYVEDDGPGIPPEERDRVLDFGHSTTPEGTGLGLSIVEQVVEAHGWDLRVTESPEGGARFEILDVETAE